MDPYALLRPHLFRLDPERAHDLAIRTVAWAGEHPGALRVLAWALAPDDERLRVQAFGLRFANPLGLAAGFDKDGVAAAAWPALGFAHAELGSVTALPQPGNAPPRLHRLVDERAIVNKMGFNNGGADALALRLRRARSRPWWPGAPVGVNVGKSRTVAVEDAVADYEQSLRSVWGVADYLVLNVSSPNTPGLRLLQEADHLGALLALAERLRRELGARPVLLKISPDLDEAGLDDIVALAERHGVAGIIATNTTIARDALRRDPGHEGGLSGAPLAPRAVAVLRSLRTRTRLPLVAVGGIESAAAAIERLEAGATLLQVYTGWIYGGPSLPRRICDGVGRWLEERGAATLQAWIDARDAAHTPLGG